MQKLPRTARVWGIAGLALILVFVAFSYRTTTEPDEESGSVVVAEKTDLTQILSAQFADEDSDGDGLRDWEESLWSTDPYNTDTDGDGTTDGDEVRQDRDPTIPGPDDSRDILRTLEKTESGDNTKTEIFAQQFFTDYIGLKQSGQLSSQFGQDFLLRQADDQIPTLTITPHKVENVRIVANTPGNIQAYGNLLGLILFTTKYPGERTELEILEEALVREDREILDELEVIEQGFESMLTSASILEVPESLVGTHLKLLDGLLSVQGAISGFRNVFEDPLTGAASLQLYQVGANQVAEALRDINLSFTGENILF